jgi:DNA invertase Pin-like site-specific DNA recombinase
MANGLPYNKMSDRDQNRTNSIQEHTMNTTGKTLQAVIYTRVSTDEQTKGTSLEEQHAACMAKARSIGAAVAATYEDGGVSGGLYLARPGIQKALEDLESGKADTLIIAKLDRCSRDREHQETIKKRVKLAGARIVFCDMDFADTPEGDLQFGILGEFAAYERNVIRDRTMKGARRAAINGLQTKLFRAPFGYYIPSKDDVVLGHYRPEQFGKYIVIEEKTRIAREIFERFGTGASVRAICRNLNERGIPTPRNGEYWRPSTIKRILNNPAYKGQATYGQHVRLHDESRLQRGFKQAFIVRLRPADEVIYIHCPAIVSVGLWDQCQKSLKENKERGSGRPDRKYLLSGLLRCPKCRRTMSGSRRMKKSSPARIASGSLQPYETFIYECSHSRPSRTTGGCACLPKQYNGKIAEALVLAAVNHAAKQPGATENAIIAFRKAQAIDFSQDEYDQLRREFKEVEKRETATVEAQIRGIACGASTAPYESALRQLALERTRIKNALDGMETQKKQVSSSSARAEAEMIAEVLQAVEEDLHAEELTEAEKRGLLARVVEAIEPVTENEGYAVTLKSFRAGALTVATIRILWPPLAATSSARFTLSWPLTSDQSTSP